MKKFIRFLNVVLAGIVAGVVTGIFLGYNPATFSYPTYLEYQRNAIESLNTLMPVLGMITILLTIYNAYTSKGDKRVMATLLIAAIFLCGAGLFTRFGNQPINALVMTWDPASPPADWAALRGDWWQFHIGRTTASVAGFCLIAWTFVRAR